MVGLLKAILKNYKKNNNMWACSDAFIFYVFKKGDMLNEKCTNYF